MIDDKLYERFMKADKEREELAKIFGNIESGNIPIDLKIQLMYVKNKEIEAIRMATEANEQYKKCLEAVIDIHDQFSTLAKKAVLIDAMKKEMKGDK